MPRLSYTIIGRKSSTNHGLGGRQLITWCIRRGQLSARIPAFIAAHMVQLGIHLIMR
jgi:hypothetical protein